MKKYFIGTIILTLITNHAIAKYTVLNDTTGGRFFVGVNALAIGFDLDYRKEPKGGNIQPYASVNLGYNVNSKLRLQAGLWYGTDNRSFESIYVESNDRLFTIIIFQTPVA